MIETIAFLGLVILTWVDFEVQQRVDSYAKGLSWGAALCFLLFIAGQFIFGRGEQQVSNWIIFSQAAGVFILSSATFRTWYYLRNALTL